MDKLPPELHATIASFTSSADHGSATRSLALTSQYFREVSRPYLYQSLAISGQAAAASLLRHLSRVTPSFQSPVKRLFLADWTRTQINEQENRPLSNDERSLDDYAAEAGTLHALIAVLAPTLEYLTFIVHNPYNATILLARVFATHFPRLEGLFLHGYYPFPHRDLSSPASMPLLRELRLSGHSNPHGLFQLGSLHVICPKLEKLTIDGVEGAPAFAAELAEAVSLSYRTEKEGMADRRLIGSLGHAGTRRVDLSQPPAPLPANLKELHVRMARMDSTGRPKGHRMRLHSRMIDLLTKFRSTEGPAETVNRVNVFVTEVEKLSTAEVHDLWLSCNTGLSAE